MLTYFEKPNDPIDNMTNINEIHNQDESQNFKVEKTEVNTTKIEQPTKDPNKDKKEKEKDKKYKKNFNEKY